MLVRAVKPNLDGLYEATKQLLIWTFSRKQSIHYTCQNNCYHSKNHTQYKRQRKWQLDNIPVKSYNLEDLRQREKNFYVPHFDVANRSEDEIKRFYEEHDIQIFGNCNEKCPLPIFNFKELDLPPETLEVIRNLNYSEPTPIQSVTWPVALSGFNMVGIARTGSGKTLGFALPGLIHIRHQNPLEHSSGPVVLVISPTRELAQQTDQVFTQFASSYSFRTACVFGGASKAWQCSRLERAQVCVATPGRLLDILNDGVVDLKNCTYVVLDEADRLLDMGFEPQISSIMNQTRPDKQVLMWSATWPKDVQQLASDFLNNFFGIRFGSSELSANPNITQRIYVCEPMDKRNLLLKTLDEILKEGNCKTLIFAQTKDTVKILQHFLRKNGFRAEVVHGDLSQRKRDTAISKFRSGSADILLGTLVVGRGLDISDIRHVIIYEFPTTIEDYVHIIGRTGRYNSEGTSHTFFTSNDSKLAGDLIKILKRADQEVNPDLLKMSNDSGRRRYERANYRARW